MSSMIAVLDANVLFPGSLRDTLLRIAERNFVVVHWTAQILEEMRRNLVAKGEMTTVQAQRLLVAMETAFPDAAIVSDYQRHIPALTNDPKDRHVLAAAIEANADSIVTFNIRDFPATALQPFTIDAMTPDDFLVELLNDVPDAMREIIIEQAAALHNPPQTVLELVQNLSIHAPKFCQRMQRILPATP